MADPPPPIPGRLAAAAAPAVLRTRRARPSRRPRCSSVPRGEQGTNGLAIAALVCAVSSIGLLVLSLGCRNSIFSLPLGAAGWGLRREGRPRDVRPGQRKAGLVLAIAAVALSVPRGGRLDRP